MSVATAEATAARLAALLQGASAELADPSGRDDLVFEESLDIRTLKRTSAPSDTWAVDGGQALVADARCLQVYATRAATVRWRDGECCLEDEGTLEHYLLGAGESRAAAAALISAGAPIAPNAEVDVNLLRDWSEWRAVAAAVESTERGAMVLVDGDLQPDWRVPSSWLASLLDRAAERGVVLAGVTKHSSLARGGTPLIGQLEREAEESLGPRATWWVPIARVRADVSGAGLRVVAARLDPDARFAFRVDLPGRMDEAGVVSALGALSALCDDAGFPGYPYPLAMADGLAACGGWVRQDARDRLEAGFDAAGVPLDVRERAFADRHKLMERA